MITHGVGRIVEDPTVFWSANPLYPLNDIPNCVMARSALCDEAISTIKWEIASLARDDDDGYRDRRAIAQ